MSPIEVYKKGIIEVMSMKIIDRSLIEMNKYFISSNDYKAAIEFLNFISKIGVDIVEIHKSILDNIEVLPQNNIYMFRITEEADWKYVYKHNIEYVLFELKDLWQYYDICSMRNGKVKKVLEIKSENIEDLIKWVTSEESELLYEFDILRIVGLGQCIPLNIKGVIEDLEEDYGILVDICPEDRYYCATAIAIEAIKNGADFVTCVFNGSGGEYGFAALEEVIMALKVIFNEEIKGDTSIFPKVKKLYEKITESFIDLDKPILGDEIFLCESGIHVDGIIKNPSNYEPFDPSLVGLKRKIVIGKHSGSAALEILLKNNNISFRSELLPQLLDLVRMQSTTLKKYIDIQLLKELYCKLSMEAG